MIIVVIICNNKIIIVTISVKHHSHEHLQENFPGYCDWGCNYQNLKGYPLVNTHQQEGRDPSIVNQVQNKTPTPMGAGVTKSTWRKQLRLEKLMVDSATR